MPQNILIRLQVCMVFVSWPHLFSFTNISHWLKLHWESDQWSRNYILYLPVIWDSQWAVSGNFSVGYLTVADSTMKAYKFTWIWHDDLIYRGKRFKPASKDVDILEPNGNMQYLASSGCEVKPAIQHCEQQFSVHNVVYACALLWPANPVGADAQVLNIFVGMHMVRPVILEMADAEALHSFSGIL